MAGASVRRSVEACPATHITPSRGSDRAPALEHALVEDVMRPGILSCGPEDDLTTVARTMAEQPRPCRRRVRDRADGLAAASD